LTEVIELPAINVGDCVNDKATYHWQLQIFLTPPSSRQKKNAKVRFTTVTLHTGPKGVQLIKVLQHIRAFLLLFRR